MNIIKSLLSRNDSEHDYIIMSSVAPSGNEGNTRPTTTTHGEGSNPGLMVNEISRSDSRGRFVACVPDDAYPGVARYRKTAEGALSALVVGVAMLPRNRGSACGGGPGHDFCAKQDRFIAGMTSSKRALDQARIPDDCGDPDALRATVRQRIVDFCQGLREDKLNKLVSWLGETDHGLAQGEIDWASVLPDQRLLPTGNLLDVMKGVNETNRSAWSLRKLTSFVKSEQFGRSASRYEPDVPTSIIADLPRSNSIESSLGEDLSGRTHLRDDPDSRPAALPASRLQAERLERARSRAEKELRSNIGNWVSSLVTVHSLLDNQDCCEHAKNFVAEIFGDSATAREGWPDLRRILGLCTNRELLKIARLAEASELACCPLVQDELTHRFSVVIGEINISGDESFSKEALQYRLKSERDRKGNGGPKIETFKTNPRRNLRESMTDFLSLSDSEKAEVLHQIAGSINTLREYSSLMNQDYHNTHHCNQTAPSDFLTYLEGFFTDQLNELAINASRLTETDLTHLLAAASCMQCELPKEVLQRSEELGASRLLSCLSAQLEDLTGPDAQKSMAPALTGKAEQLCVSRLADLARLVSSCDMEKLTEALFSLANKRDLEVLKDSFESGPLRGIWHSMSALRDAGVFQANAGEDSLMPALDLLLRTLHDAVSPRLGDFKLMDESLQPHFVKEFGIALPTRFASAQQVKKVHDHLNAAFSSVINLEDDFIAPTWVIQDADLAHSGTEDRGSSSLGMSEDKNALLSLSENVDLTGLNNMVASHRWVFSAASADEPFLPSAGAGEAQTRSGRAFVQDSIRFWRKDDSASSKRSGLMSALCSIRGASTSRGTSDSAGHARRSTFVTRLRHDAHGRPFVLSVFFG